MKILAILNATPDSFSGDGQQNLGSIVAQAKAAIQNGANILDIGGESTRPGSKPITAEEEQQRVLPAIQAIKKVLPNAVISIDTYRAATAQRALENGASIINDITGGDAPTMLALAAQQDCPIILMHNAAQRDHISKAKTGNSYAGKEMPIALFLKHLTEELIEITQRALNAGISPQNIILDPGLGFGKTVIQNLAIIKNLPQLKKALNQQFNTLQTAKALPLLIGASRKSFIGAVLDTTVDDRLVGSLACAYAASQNGAEYLRVHDVKETAQTVKMQQALR